MNILSLRRAAQQPVDNAEKNKQVAWAGNNRPDAVGYNHPIGQYSKRAGLNDDILGDGQERARRPCFTQRRKRAGMNGHCAAVIRHD